MNYATQHPNRELSLDVLRAVAIIMVLGYHLFPEWVPLGYLGVDVFFVLSGVFIVRQMGRRDALPLPYLWKRVLRLWPAILAMLIGTFILGWFALLPSEYTMLARNGVFALSFATNFGLTNLGGYFGPMASENPLLHMWSVAVEAQVYLVSAALLPLALRCFSLPWVLAAVACASFLHIASSPNDADLFFDPLARGWQFALGGAAGLLRGKFPHFPWGFAPISAILLCGSALAAGNGFGPFPALAASGLAAAFIILVTDGNQRAPISLHIGAWIGQASFGIYLWHWPLIVLSDMALLFERNLGISLWIAILSILLGRLSFLFIEAPARSPIAPTLLKLTGLFMTGFIVLTMATAVVVNRGFPNRLPPRAHAILDQTLPAHDLLQTCHIFPNYPATGFPVAKACRHNADKGPVLTAVLGDSHSGTLSGGLARAGLPFVEYSYSGCAPTTTLYPEGHGPACPGRTEEAIQAILADQDVKTVIIAARWAFYTQPRFDNGKGGRDKYPDVVMRRVEDGSVVSDLRVRSEMRRTFLRLLDAGKTVIAVGPTPVFGWDVRVTAARRAWRGFPVALEVSRDQMDDRQSAMIDMLQKIDAPTYRFIDPRPLFCDSKVCRAEAPDGTLLLNDQDHLSRAGADLLSRLLLDAIQNISGNFSPD